MDKKCAIDAFYRNNKIDISRATDVSSADYDICLEKLEEKTEEWLKNVDALDKPIFLDVLSKVLYYTQAHCMQHWVEVIELLKEDIGKYDIDISEVLIIVVESPNGSKSGAEDIIGDLYKRNRFENITKANIASSFNKFDIKKISNYKAVLFLDDMIGSGITLSKTITDVTCKIENSNHTPIRYYCSCITPTKRGVKLIKCNARKKNIILTFLFKDCWYVNHIFKQGSNEYLVFEKYERLIEKYYEESGKTFFMGFMKATLGVVFYYNTPNNTISTLWCETNNNHPPFWRDGNQITRPSIDALKSIKKTTDKNSYISVSERNDTHQ